MEVGSLDSAEDSDFDGMGGLGVVDGHGEVDLILRRDESGAASEDDVLDGILGDMPQDVQLERGVDAVDDDALAGVLTEMNGAGNSETGQSIADGDPCFLEVGTNDSG